MPSGEIFAVDLFCGAGGLTRGLLDAGISVVAGYDSDPLCEFAYTSNNNCKFVLKDIQLLEGKELEQHFPGYGHRVLVGCAPCQPFSSYTQGKRKIRRNDSRWGLLPEFSRLVRETSPDVVSIENVPHLQRSNLFKTFLEQLKKLGYRGSYEVVDCRLYGVPQHRKRLVLLASKHGPISLPKPDPNATCQSVREVIAHLDPLRDGETSTVDRLHKCMGLSPKNRQRIQQSRPGGSWREWDTSLVADCHKRDTGKKYGSVYGRMEWDQPAPTITTQALFFGSGRFGHPEQDRPLSLREAALLQTFPPDYHFFQSGQARAMRDIARLIGNAVPVRLARVVADTIRAHLASIRKF